MKWYFDALRKYAVFDGRARRREYWMFELWNTLIVLALFILYIIAGSKTGQQAVGLLLYIYGVAIVVPSISVLVRRLHDTNHSGSWIFIALVPLIGALILVRRLHDTNYNGFWIFITLFPLIGALIHLVLTIRDGDRGDNRYGPNPKIRNWYRTPEMGWP